ncbi:MAG: thiosulfohydrolase SoxB [Candidatus Thiodiazotropha sp.]
MSISRREFLRLMGLAGAAGLMPSSVFAAKKLPANLYDVPKFGNLSLLHITDTHAQLNPIYFREPNVNLGIDYAFNKAPHLVGERLLKHFGIAPGSIEAHAFSYLDFDTAAGKYGKVGGFAHLKSLVQRIRDDRGPGNSLLLDGGDTWQGSGTAYWTRGKDMVGACNRLGVDVMTGHWEFTYLDEEVVSNIADFKGDFVAQNVRVREEALFDYKFSDFEGFNEDEGNAFKPYVIKQVGGARVAVIGQAFPYTPIANPQRFIPDWTFGIQDELMQGVVDTVRENEKPDVVVVISHNGMDVDLKMASRVSGIDVIMGGHTHDGMPAPTVVKNAGGKTLVTNAGSNGKFLGVMDLDVKGGKVRDFRYRLLPIFSNLLPADKEMQAYIDEVRAPYKDKLEEKLAVTEETLYRRGNFNGTFDQVICDALTTVNDAQISLSPGFRWGTTVLPGQTITMDNVMDQTCITYPETYRREMKGSDIKAILEDVCDNLFNKDPYYQQGGDMVRVGGLDYVCEPGAGFGKRISNMTLDDGTKVEADKNYVVSGWATVGSKAPGEPIWDTVAKYLRDQKTVKIQKINTPKLVGMKDNPGLADYPG